MRVKLANGAMGRVLMSCGISMRAKTGRARNQ